MAYFTDNSADQLIAQSLKTGDVLLVNRRCTALPAPSAMLCWLSKFGLSGDGRDCWDHAALVVRDERTDVPYLLEGTPRGVTLRSYEERLMQSGDLSEVKLYRLLGERDTPALSTFLHEELKMSKSIDGFDAETSACLTNKCWNLWSVYRHHRLGEGPRRMPSEQRAQAKQQLEVGPCGFGAPLVATALQRLGVLSNTVDASTLLPLHLPLQQLLGDARLAPPVVVRR
eukprot:scaffold36891_cov26-Tisochrysis_lutea.AAC.1